MHRFHSEHYTLTCEAAATSHELLKVGPGQKFRCDLLHAHEVGDYGDLVAQWRIRKGLELQTLVVSTDIDKSTPLQFVESFVLTEGWEIILYTDAVTAGDQLEAYISGCWLD